MGIFELATGRFSPITAALIASIPLRKKNVRPPPPLRNFSRIKGRAMMPMLNFLPPPWK